MVLESRHEWDFKQQRYDVEARASQEGQLSETGRYTASFELSADEDFPEADSWRPYRDLEGTAYVTDATTGRTFVVRE